MAKMNNNEGGYECEFVEKPPEALQSSCPVCQLILREPYQVNCCGYVFCQTCIDGVKSSDKPCPCCKTVAFATFEDKRLKRSLHMFRILCTNKQQGCQWKGELGQLDNHLNYNPTKDKQLQGCQFSKVECLYCSESFLRSDIQTHQSNQCPRRPFSCQYCEDLDSSYEDVTTNHWPVCGYYPLPCPKKCGESIQRQNIESHISNDCPLTIIDCGFQHVGCEVRLSRKDMPAHLQESMVRHMSLHALSYKRVVANVVRLEEENKELKKQVARLTQDLQMYNISTPTCPVEFTMTNFKQKIEDKEEWRSPPFYTHQNGYKLKVRIGACVRLSNGQKYTSAHLILMKGENDNKLKWPFKGKFVIKLFNQDQDEWHYAHTFDFSNPECEEACARVINREQARFMLGNDNFISHSEVLPKYLKNDCLRFRVEYL